MKLSELLLNIDKLGQSKGLSPCKIVGGLARDKVLNRTKEINDVDLTTGDGGIHYLAKECSIVMRSPSLKYFVMPDGHARITIQDFKLDFSSNFRIPNIDEILKTMNIESPSEMVKELYSRDFTCNTLLMSMDLKNIEDPIGRGVSDINDKVLKTCLVPDITLGQDHKRVARIIYLSAKLGFEVDKEILNWVKEHPETLTDCKQDYLAKKLTKALNYNKDITLHLLDSLGLWPYVPATEAFIPFMNRAGRQ